jgi:hypothetical protein
MRPKLAASAGRDQDRDGLLSPSSTSTLVAWLVDMNRIRSYEALAAISSVAFTMLDIVRSMFDWPEQIQTSPKRTSLRVRGVERPSVMTMLQKVAAA